MFTVVKSYASSIPLFHRLHKLLINSTIINNSEQVLLYPKSAFNYWTAMSFVVHAGDTYNFAWNCNWNWNTLASRSVIYIVIYTQSFQKYITPRFVDVYSVRCYVSTVHYTSSMLSNSTLLRFFGDRVYKYQRLSCKTQSNVTQSSKMKLNSNKMKSSF